MEGVDDKHVVAHLCKQANSTQNFVIEEKEGVNNLIKSLPVEMAVASRKALGVIVDANNDLVGRWQAVRSRLQSRGIALPSAPVAEGLVVDSEPKVGVWLMPDNSSPGQIEDFVAAMIPESDPVWSHAQSFVNNLPDQHRPQPAIKAMVHTWLAVCAGASKMGSAIGSGHFDISMPVASLFLDWLVRLYSKD